MCARYLDQPIETSPPICVRKRLERRLRDARFGGEYFFKSLPADGRIGGPVRQPRPERLAKGGPVGVDTGKRDVFADLGSGVSKRPVPGLPASDERPVEVETRCWHGFGVREYGE